MENNKLLIVAHRKGITLTFTFAMLSTYFTESKIRNEEVDIALFLLLLLLLLLQSDGAKPPVT